MSHSRSHLSYHPLRALITAGSLLLLLLAWWWGASRPAPATVSHPAAAGSLEPGGMVVADMVPDNPSIWLYHRHVNDHISAGMMTRYRVLA